MTNKVNVHPFTKSYNRWAAPNLSLAYVNGHRPSKTIVKPLHWVPCLPLVIVFKISQFTAVYTSIDACNRGNRDWKYVCTTLNETSLRITILISKVWLNFCAVVRETIRPIWKTLRSEDLRLQKQRRDRPSCIKYQQEKWQKDTQAGAMRCKQE